VASLSRAKSVVPRKPKEGGGSQSKAGRKMHALFLSNASFDKSPKGANSFYDKSVEKSCKAKRKSSNGKRNPGEKRQTKANHHQITRKLVEMEEKIVSARSISQAAIPEEEDDEERTFKPEFLKSFEGAPGKHLRSIKA